MVTLNALILFLQRRYSIDVLRIPPNMTAEILGGSVGSYAGSLRLQITCDSGWRFENAYIGATYTLTHLPSDGSGCDVTNSDMFSGYWTATYILHNATVV